MYISRDYSYNTTDEMKLVEKGYGELTVHSIHFDRYYTEEQKEKNRQLAESMTREEWSEHCNDIAESFSKPMMEILEKFISKYNIHQISKETSTMEHYTSDWDLYFWSDRGWNEKDYMTCFKLNFNTKREPKQNMELLEEIISFISLMEYENIGCRIQYDVAINEKKVAEKVDTVYENHIGKFVEYQGMIGKLKVVREENGMKEYGFFKKNARSKYYSIPNTKILTRVYNI